jgi:hypothetical protein
MAPNDSLGRFKNGKTIAAPLVPQARPKQQK